MKRDNLFYLFIIVIFGLLLRIMFIDKPEGLWNDEYVGWHIASQEDLWIFFQNMVRNCHTPFYYIYLKIWMFLFGDSDRILRYSSVLPSTLSIIVMFFAGKHLGNRRLGYLCAFITAISSFLIYFAQEVRLYSLLFLFSALTNLHAIKLLKKTNKIDMLFLFVYCMLLVLTHTLGIIYVFLLLSILSYFIIEDLDEKERKKVIKNLITYVLYPTIIIGILIFPFLYNILTYKSLSQFWTGFSVTKIILTICDYFSPIQSNIINTAESIRSYLMTGSKPAYHFITYAIIPVLIVLFGIGNALKTKNKKIICLFSSALLFFIYLILIAYTERMILLTKYTTEMYPSLILVFCYGLYRLKNKKISIILITTYITLNLFFIFTQPTAANKLSRPEGHKAVVELLRNSYLKNDDYVIITYYDTQKFNKYFSKNDKYKIFSINKFNFNIYMYNDSDYKSVIQNGKYKYKDMFRNLPNKNIISFVEKEFIKKMKKGDRIGIITLNSVSFLSNKDIIDVLDDKKRYEKAQYIFMVFSALKNSLYASFKDKYTIETITQAGSWTLVVFKKTKD